MRAHLGELKINETDPGGFNRIAITLPVGTS